MERSLRRLQNLVPINTASRKVGKTGIGWSLKKIWGAGQGLGRRHVTKGSDPALVSPGNNGARTAELPRASLLRWTDIATANHSPAERYTALN